MKNIAVLSVLVIIFSVYSYAEENKGDYCFSFGPQFGIVYGQAREYVFPIPGETKGELLSELTWDMKPVFYYGIQAEFSRADLMKGPGVFSSFLFKIGIPADSGIMEDRDWQSIENGDLTNYSRHSNRTNGFFQFDAAFGASFPIKSSLYLKPFISGSWMSFVFSGRNGYGVYAKIKSSGTYYSIDDNPNRLDFSGKKVISYQQDWLLIATGLTAGTNILYPFSFDISFQISPLTYCMAEDNHLLVNTIFRDNTGRGLFIDTSFKMSFIVKPFEFSLGLGFRHIGKTKGKSYTNINNTGFQLGDNKAGAGLSMLDSRFLINFRL